MFFFLFLKSLVSETVRRSAGRELYDAGPEKEKARRALRTWCAAEVWCSWPFQRKSRPERVTL